MIPPPHKDQETLREGSHNRCFPPPPHPTHGRTYMGPKEGEATSLPPQSGRWMQQDYSLQVILHGRMT